MATKILDSGGPYFANPCNPNQPFRKRLRRSRHSENPVDQIRLEEAFAAAARVDEALERAVSRKFKDDGEYKATNPLNLNLPEYMGVVMFTVFTLGAGIFIYNSLSAETNAAKDDYKRRVEAHFDVSERPFARHHGKIAPVGAKIPAAGIRAAGRLFVADGEGRSGRHGVGHFQSRPQAGRIGRDSDER